MVYMGIVKTELKGERNELFRKMAMERFGHSKGAIGKAMNEAIEDWLKSRRTKKSTVTLKELRGIWKDINISSLKLQKEAVRLWGKVD